MVWFGSSAFGRRARSPVLEPQGSKCAEKEITEKKGRGLRFERAGRASKSTPRVPNHKPELAARCTCPCVSVGVANKVAQLVSADLPPCGSSAGLRALRPNAEEPTHTKRKPHDFKSCGFKSCGFFSLCPQIYSPVVRAPGCEPSGRTPKNQPTPFENYTI